MQNRPANAHRKRKHTAGAVQLRVKTGADHAQPWSAPVQACGKNIRKSLLRCCADHPARVADGQAVGRNVLGDDTARANDAVRADRHAGQDDGAGTNPNIVADMNGMRVLQPLQPLPNIHRVFFHDDADAGGDKHVVADGYFSAVHELAVDIEEEVIAHRGVISVGAKEGLLHNTVVSALPSSPRMAACRAPQSSGCIWLHSWSFFTVTSRSATSSGSPG